MRNLFAVLLATCLTVAGCGASNRADLAQGVGTIAEISAAPTASTVDVSGSKTGATTPEMGPSTFTDCYTHPKRPESGDARSEPAAFGDTIQRVATWVEIEQTPTLLESLESLEPFEFADWSVIGVDTASADRVDTEVAAPWLLAELVEFTQVIGQRVVLGISESHGSPRGAVVILVERGDALEPWGLCSGVERRNELARRYVRDAGDDRVLSPPQVWSALIGERPGPTVSEFGGWALAIEYPEEPDRPSFDDIDPRERFANIEDLPADLVATAVQLDLAIGVPEAWRSASDVSICTWTPMGWNECSIFEIPEEYDNDGRFHLDGLRQPGDPVEVWLLTEQADIAGPAARFGTIETSQAAVANPIPVDVDIDLLPPGAAANPRTLLDAAPPSGVIVPADPSG